MSKSFKYSDIEKQKTKNWIHYLMNGFHNYQKTKQL